MLRKVLREVESVRELLREDLREPIGGPTGPRRPVKKSGETFENLKNIKENNGNLYKS